MNPFRSLVLLLLLATSQLFAEEIFSGPQIGEPTVPFKAKVVFGENAGKTITVLEEITPTLLIFVHEITRPSVGLTRLVTQFAETKKKAGLQTQLVFLSEDWTETGDWMKRARHALPKSSSPLISVDGIEGPGIYGLNRNVKLTILVADKGKVTANFAIGQPSIQVDGPKIGHAIVKVSGGTEAPTLKEMGFKAPRMNQKKMADQLSPEQNTKYRSLMAPVIRGETEEAVEKAAAALEAHAAKNKWLDDKVKSAASMIVSGGKLENYGKHPKAKEYLKKWADASSKEMKRKTDAAESEVKKATK